MAGRIASFRTRLQDNERLAGTFLKTPSSIVCEVLGLSTLDVVCIDTEHAPFGRLELDQCIAALRGTDMPSLVRVPGDSPHHIRNALDCGANGIVVPHVTTAEQAEAIVKAAHFGEGGRGYAGSSRAARFTLTGMKEHLSRSRDHTAIVLQIEDIAALDNVAQIAAVDGVDALFIGRADLAVAMEKDVSHRDVIATVGDICIAAREADKAVGLFTPDPEEIPAWAEKGASLFLLSSDQNFMLAGANALADGIRS